MLVINRADILDLVVVEFDTLTYTTLSQHL